MRKLGIIVTALACLAIMAVAAQAVAAEAGGDMKGQFAVGVVGGMAVPTGALAEKFSETTEGVDMKAGPTFGVFSDYFVTKDLAIGLDFSYTAMTTKDQTILDVTLSDLFKAKTMQFGVHGKYFVPTGGSMVPYLSVGAGLYNRKLELSEIIQLAAETSESELSDSKMGVNLGVGFEYRASPVVGFGVNGAYHLTMGKLEHDFGTGVKEEILKDWNYIAFDAALTLHIPMAK